MTIVLKDITRLKELEVQTQRARQLQAMGEMAVQLAHEIRNPLGSIELFASLLSTELKDQEDFKGWADQIVAAVNFLNNIVTNMLTFTRTSKPEMRSLDLRELVLETLAFVEPVLKQRSIRLEQPVAGDDRLLCLGDHGMLRQMFLNLFMNALQAMPESGRLAVRVQPDHAGSQRVEVEDSGIGIPTENLSRIFDPFFTTNEKGTGLGLALVHQIVEKHQGRIAAQSEAAKERTGTVVIGKDVRISAVAITQEQIIGKVGDSGRQEHICTSNYERVANRSIHKDSCSQARIRQVIENSIVR